MKNLNQLIRNYTFVLQQGEYQVASKGILEFIGELRSHHIKSYPYYETSGIYQGIMDMSYFSLSNKRLKDKGLKIAILYLHQKGNFEVWLSACKREISRIYNTIICEQNSHMNITHFQDQKNPDAILESTLITTSYL